MYTRYIIPVLLLTSGMSCQTVTVPANSDVTDQETTMNDTIQGEGTIVWNAFEGGFFGIQANNGGKVLSSWFLGRGVPGSWPGCKIRAQTEAGCGDNCDVGYTGIGSQHCKIRRVVRLVTLNSTMSGTAKGAYPLEQFHLSLSTLGRKACATRRCRNQFLALP